MKLPLPTLPVSVSQVANRAIVRLRALPRRIVIACGVTLAMVLLFLGVSLLPGPAPTPEPQSTVIRLQLDQGAKPARGLLDPGQDGGAAAGAGAGLLIAANGAVISDPALIEMTSDGPLPRIAEDGRTPMATYARKTDTKESRPRIAILITGLGLSQSGSMAALDTLPPGVTLGFSPYGSGLPGLVSAARGKGNEVVMELPLEPYDFPNNDPGQQTLIAGASPRINGERLRWILSRFTGYAGLTGMEGGKFLASPKDARMLMEAAQRRGLYFVDSAISDQSAARDTAVMAGTSFARADIRVDANPSPEMMAEALAALEKLAMQKGSAIAVAGSYPGTVGKISTWANELEQKGFALVPLSALLIADVRKVPPAAPAPASAPGPEPKPPALRGSDAREAGDAPRRALPEAGKKSGHSDGETDPHAGPHP